MYNSFILQPFQSCCTASSGVVYSRTFQMAKVRKLLKKVFKVLFSKFTNSKVFAKERHPVTVYHTAHFFTVVVPNRLFMCAFILNVFRLFRSPKVYKKLTKLHSAFRIQSFITFCSNFSRNHTRIRKGIFLVNYNNLFLRSFYTRSRSNHNGRSRNLRCWICRYLCNVCI